MRKIVHNQKTIDDFEDGKWVSADEILLTISHRERKEEHERRSPRRIMPK